MITTTVTVRFDNDLQTKLLHERARIDRSINWIIRESVRRYFDAVELELSMYSAQVNKKKKK